MSAFTAQFYNIYQISRYFFHEYLILSQTLRYHFTYLIIYNYKVFVYLFLTGHQQIFIEHL